MRFASDKYIELIVENKFNEADEYRKSFIPDFLYKFVPLRSETTEEAQRENQKRLDSLEKGEIWFSSRALMNDPYEFIGMYIDESKLLKDGWPPEAVAAVQDKAKNLLFLSSLTSNVYNNMLIGLTQQGTRFRCLSQLILAVPAIESGVKLIHTNHIL